MAKKQDPIEEPEVTQEEVIQDTAEQANEEVTNEEPQDTAEQANEEVQEEVTNEEPQPTATIMLVDDGVAVIDGDHALVISLHEEICSFGCGIDSQDEETGVPSPSMDTFDGEMRTQFLTDFYHPEDGALIIAREYGWLPSGGEMKFIFDHKDAINAIIQEAGGDIMADDDYWTSQRFSNDRMWSCNMSDGTFSIDRGCISELRVRPVKAYVEA